MHIPPVGAGTFRLQGQQAIASVANALELGYRHIDTARIYGNEAEVGQALAASGVARDEVFVTTKVWTEHLAGDKLIPSLKESLHKLRLDALDLTLIHWPSPGGAVPVAESMAALLEAKKPGLTRAIGMSNFTIGLMRKAIDAVGAANIATSQVELHPYLQNRAVSCSHGRRSSTSRPTCRSPMARCWATDARGDRRAGTRRTAGRPGLRPALGLVAGLAAGTSTRM